MTIVPARGTTAGEREALRAAIEGSLTAQDGRRQRIVTLEHRPSPYQTSFRLVEIDVHLDDGRLLRILWKSTNWQALSVGARSAKPAFLHDPRREIEIYRRILAPQKIASPQFYGASVDPHLGRYWLFLQRLEWPPLSEVGDLRAWTEAARWLARLHCRFTGANDRLPGRQFLLRYDWAFYRRWPARAQTFAARTGRSLAERTRLQWLASRYDRVVDQLLSLPTTLLHGEFYASNVLARPPSANKCWRIYPVDWEMTGIGPGLIDLAALIAGRWTDEQRQALVGAYYEALEAGSKQPFDSFRITLDACRLHLAMQWLGWSSDWNPPVGHAHDWLDEAIALAEALDM